MNLYRGTIARALRAELGFVRLTELNASRVQDALSALASRSSTSTVQIAHNVLVRAIRRAERDDLVVRNVAALVGTPKGQQEGWPSKSLTLTLDEVRDKPRTAISGQLQVRHKTVDDHRNAVAAFVEKRTPVFSAPWRRP